MSAYVTDVNSSYVKENHSNQSILIPLYIKNVPIAMLREKALLKRSVPAVPGQSEHHRLLNALAEPDKKETEYLRELGLPLT